MRGKVALALLGALALTLTACGEKPAASDPNEALKVGFSQIGSESGWRTAETRMAQAAAKARGVDLRISDAQQRQENQIRAIRAFVAQGVDAIFLAPVVSTGWDEVLLEAKDAAIPVFLLDRRIETKNADLVMTAVVADNRREGRVAGEWLLKTVGARKCPVVELQGTVGSTLVADRKTGFEEAIAASPNVSIVRTQSGEFTRAKGKEVMEGFIKALGAKDICAVYAHNDDMMIGAIQAMNEAGMRPGKDTLTVSVDAVPDIFKAMMDGTSNATVELSPDMGEHALDALIAYKRDGKIPPKVFTTPSTLYLPATAAAEYERRKALY